MVVSFRVDYPMRIEVRTKTGLVYVLDNNLMGWACKGKTGKLSAWPIIAVDKDMDMCSNPDVQSWRELDALQVIPKKKGKKK